MGQADGMQTLEMHLSQLVTDGIIDRDEAVHRSLYPKEIAKAPAVPVAAGV
jgi:Tfp pilus assembly pilus retraction ATPase PilT